MSDEPEFFFRLKGGVDASAIEDARRAFAESVFRTLAAAPPFDVAGLARALEPTAASIAAVRSAALLAVSPPLRPPTLGAWAAAVADIESAVRGFDLSAFGPYGDGCAAGRAVRATLDDAKEVPGVM